MLQAIRDYLQEAESTSFSTYYQQFIVDSQDRIIDSDISRTRSKLQPDFNDLSSLVRSLNDLTEEMNSR